MGIELGTALLVGALTTAAVGTVSVLESRRARKKQREILETQQAAVNVAEAQRQAERKRGIEAAAQERISRRRQGLSRRGRASTIFAGGEPLSSAATLG